MSKKARKYNAQYYIDKFSKIPHKNWTIRILWDRNVDAEIQCCALGHCGVRSGFHNTEESLGLRRLFREHFADSDSYSIAVTEINDGDLESKQFKQKTPKGRIIAALKLIEKDGG